MKELIKNHSPTSILEIASSLRDVFTQKHKESYSQSGEDMILNTIFVTLRKVSM